MTIINSPTSQPVFATPLVNLSVNLNSPADVQRLRELMAALLSTSAHTVAPPAAGTPEVLETSKTADALPTAIEHPAAPVVAPEQPSAVVPASVEIPLVSEKRKRKAGTDTPSAPVTQPVVPLMPTPATVAALEPKDVLTPATVATLEKKDVLAAVDGYVRQKGVTALRTLLAKHGGGSFNQLDQAVYPALLADIKAGEP